ncbi:MAG: hypothetical protein HRU10_14895, partial [Opitutales bacterium]|nr:hypothetical protein [Opitutales bacterium]
MKNRRAYDGTWEKYDYYGPPSGSQRDKRGLVHRIYSPSIDNNASPLTSNGNGSPGVAGFSGFVTEYDYVGSDGSNSDDDFEEADLPTLRRQYLNNRLMGKTTYDYSSSSSNILVTKIRDFASDASNDYLETIQKRYRTGYSNEKISGLPYSVNTADNTRTSFGYQWRSATKEFLTFELSGTLDPDSQGAMNAELITHVNWTGEVLDTENLYLVPNQSIITLTTRDIRGLVKRVQSYVFTGDPGNNGVLNGTDNQLVASTSYTYNDLGAILTERNDINGLQQTMIYDAHGRMLTRADASGLVTHYSGHNNLGTPEIIQQNGVKSSVHGSGASVNLQTLHTYDALGRLTDSIRDGGGETLTQEFVYDLGGVRTREILPCGKRIDYTPQIDGTHYRKLKVSEKSENGATEYRSYTQHFYIDGSLKSISGDAQVNIRNTYEVTAQGQLISFTDYGTTDTHGGNGDKHGRESITVSDWLGRTVGAYTKAMPNGMNGNNVQHHHSGDKWLLNRYVYGTQGNTQAGKLYQDLTYIVPRANFRQELAPTNSGAPTGSAQSRVRNLYAYDHLGQLLHQALDLNNNSQIDASNTQLDRLTTYHSYAEKWGSNWFWVDVSYVWDERGSNAPVAVSNSFTMSRFSGYNTTGSNRTISETRAFQPIYTTYSSNTSRMTTITQ